MGSKQDSLRNIPSVDRLLNHAQGERLLARFARSYVVQKCREELDALRAAILREESLSPETCGEEALLAGVERRISEESDFRLRRVVNATGTILHTNLGRAILPAAAVEALSLTGANAVNLEYDLQEGKRGRREESIDKLLVELTGAEAATVVNNNAAAVLLALNTVAAGKDVIVSRGELIEIGGSFRIPEIMAKSGATLKEVGTTNRTHPDDYEQSIGDKSALLLKVHASNYKIIGFAAEVTLSELVALGRRRSLPVMEDLGSGALVDLSRYGLPKEPVVAESVAAGADLVTFSGDKILGGPQAGLIVGKADWIRKLNQNPLKRALRCGKLALGALEATLLLYRQSGNPTREIPTLRAFARPMEEIRRMGERLLSGLRENLGHDFSLSLEDSICQIGSGALPAEEIPSQAIAIRHPSISAERIAKRFRSARPPILGRIEDKRFLLDLRAVFDPEDLIPHFEQDSVKR